jgi:2'-5' RNA ligase/GNAT superfamily N-acetyltransferase
MARLRLGVVVLVPRPTAFEIDGLRRGCGDTALGRVPPHITLVPPVNVSQTRVPEALSLLRRAASQLEPFELALGPVTTFAPDSPTVYLAVGGAEDGLASLHRLREAVFEAPLHRELSWPFVPHVTIADEAGPERITAAVHALADYHATITIRAVHLLHEARIDSGPQWSPIADYRFGPPIPVARGGLPLDLWLSDQADPEARVLLEAEDLPLPPSGERTLTVTARRRDEVVGVLWGHDEGAASRATALVVAPDHRKQGIAHHLHTRFVSEVESHDQVRRHT